MTELELYWKELCARAGIEDNDSRCLDIVTLRYIYFNYARKNTVSTWDTIGKVVGRNHSTVIAGIKKYNDLIDVKDPYLLQMIERIESKKWYQTVVCPKCNGYILCEPVPVKNGLIYGQLIGKGYVVKYQNYKPLVKCECNTK